MKAVMVDSDICDLFTSFNTERSILAEAGIDLVVGNAKTPDEYIALCKDADAILLIGTVTDKSIIDKLEKCKVIVRYGVGYDVVDVDSCSNVGIAVCNIPMCGTTEVAAQALALALNCMRKVTYYDRQIRKGIWHPGSFNGYELHRISQMTLGLCGFGNIAQTLSMYAKPIFGKIIAYDPYVDSEIFAKSGVTQVSFNELLMQSDVISIHTPLNSNTYRMFSKTQFETMKKGMIIINTARGGVICQNDLLDAIDNGIVKAVGLDVMEDEPIRDFNCRLLKYDVVVVTPHAGTESKEYFASLQEDAARTVIRVLSGELPYNVLNKRAIIEYRNSKLAANKL